MRSSMKPAIYRDLSLFFKLLHATVYCLLVFIVLLLFVSHFTQVLECFGNRIDIGAIFILDNLFKCKDEKIT